MSDTGNKLDTKISAYAMRFVRNSEDFMDGECVLELTDGTETEVEFGFFIGRDRYYLRVNRADLARILEPSP